MILHEVDSLPVVVPANEEESGARLTVVGRLTKTSILKLLLDKENH